MVYIRAVALILIGKARYVVLPTEYVCIEYIHDTDKKAAQNNK